MDRHMPRVTPEIMEVLEQLMPATPVPIVDVDHADFAKIASEVAELVAAKNAAYGDSFGRSGAVLLALFPDGIPTERYTDMLTIVRMVDKLFRLATNNDPMGESPAMDLMGYALLAESRRRKAAR